MIFETKDYKIEKISLSWYGPAVIYITNSQFGDAGEKIAKELEQIVSAPFTFCELSVDNWDKYLTPWKADANMKGRTFEGLANELLQSIEANVIPKIRSSLDNDKIYIAGYSLAGLFSLWSLYESKTFDGAACCSGSLWYPGWMDFAKTHSLQNNSKVYFSLGNKEKNTKHPLMKNIESNMLENYELIKNDKKASISQMDFNEGGHFSNTEERMLRGISWLLQ